MRYMINMRHLRDIRDIRYMRYLSDMIFTQDTALTAVKRLNVAVDQDQRGELLSILLGRMLQIAEADEKGGPVEQEVQEIVQCGYPAFTSSEDAVLREAALDLLRYL